MLRSTCLLRLKICGYDPLLAYSLCNYSARLSPECFVLNLLHLQSSYGKSLFGRVIFKFKKKLQLFSRSLEGTWLK